MDSTIQKLKQANVPDGLSRLVQAQMENEAKEKVRTILGDIGQSYE